MASNEETETVTREETVTEVAPVADTPHPDSSPASSSEILDLRQDLDSFRADMNEFRKFFTAEVLAALAVLSEAINEIQEEDSQPQSGSWLYRRIKGND